MSEEITTVEKLYDVLVHSWSDQYVSCHLVLGPLLSAPGTLHLDGHELRFERSRGLSGLLAPSSDIVLALVDISHVQYTKADVRFSLKNKKVISFRGRQLVAIVAWLYALGWCRPYHGRSKNY